MKGPIKVHMQLQAAYHSDLCGRANRYRNHKLRGRDKRLVDGRPQQIAGARQHQGGDFRRHRRH
jgi:hypothetical protein